MPSEMILVRPLLRPLVTAAGTLRMKLTVVRGRIAHDLPGVS